MQQFDDCRDLIGRMKAVMDSAQPPQWLLMGPDGRVWQGSQQDVARVLLQNIDIAALFTSPTTK